MGNYVVIDGVKTALTGSIVAQIKELLKEEPVQLSEAFVGETVNVGGYEFIVLDQMDGETALICKDKLGENVEFGQNNNYDSSNPDEACKQFALELASIVGGENMVEHLVDLTSNDGLTDYGALSRTVSLLTADRYRRYVCILDQHKIDDWWWLATPWSTNTHEGNLFSLCVSPSGCIYYDLYGHDGGVRPFCILKSHIFVSN